MSWTLPGYHRDETPPAGALVFDPRDGRDNRERIYVSFLTQSPERMRDATPLSLTPPIRSPIRVPACSGGELGYSCAADDFAKTVAGALDVDCIERP